MNCQECRSLVERFLDHALTGFTKRKVNLHLSRCADCRAYFDRRRENQALAYRALNAALADTHLPEGFAERFRAAHVVPERRFRLFRFGKPWKVAAVLAVMVSLAGFASMVLMVSIGNPLADTSPSLLNDGSSDVPLQLEDVLGANAYPAEDGIDEESVSTSSTSNEKENQNMTTRRKMTAVVSAAALAAASPNLASAGNGETYTSASYVQDGLIAQWDGIDNAGKGTHDSNALVWKDLKGSCDMTLQSKGNWANGNALSVTGFGACGSGAAPEYRTIEVVYKMTSSTGRILFTSGRAASNGKLSQMVGFSVIGGNNLAGFFDGTGTAATRYIRVNFDANAVCSMSAIHENGMVAETYCNGVVDMYQKLDTNWGVVDGKVAVGARNGTTDTYTWTGEVFAIRLYSTALTKEQIAANLAVDAARFGVYEYKYLVFGDPIASAMARSWTAAEAAPSTAVEARYRTREWSDGIALDATELHLGTVFSFR